MSRYSSTNMATTRGVRRQLTTQYPDIPFSFDDDYVITTGGDRFDLLANEYYGSSSYWWVIAVANPHISRKDFVIKQGEQLRIPANLADIVANFEEQNEQNTL